MNKTVQVIIYVAAIIVLIFSISILSKKYLSESSEKLEYHVSIVENNVRSNNWSDIETNLSEIEKEWDQTQKVWAMLIDHMEIDNINTAMAKMTELIKLKEKSLALSEAQVVKHYLRHIPDKISFTLENIF